MNVELPHHGLMLFEKATKGPTRSESSAANAVGVCGGNGGTERSWGLEGYDGHFFFSCLVPCK